ncbi:MAG TPA: ribonuclease HI [Planctomycetota bacterium]|nr:ribonuclease HI [Planctomycetota bacterium]
MTLTIHFDGLCLPKNPGGVATYGFVAKRGAKVLHEEGGLAARPYTPEATNNVAEYTGVLKALEWALAQGFDKEKVLVRGDSQLVIRQLKGEYKVKSPSIVNLFKRVRELAGRFSSISFEWIPREENKEADALTNRAYAEFGAGKRTERRREDASARIRRGFSIEIETPAAPAAAFRALGHASMPKAKVESSLPPNLLILNHDDGATTVLSVTRLSDGARIRCEHARPAGEDDAAALQAAERAWHAALLALQSRLEGSP